MVTYSARGRICGVVFDIDNTLYRNDDYTRAQHVNLIRKLADRMEQTYRATNRMVEDRRQSMAQQYGGGRPSLAATFESFGIDIETSVQWRQEVNKPEQYLQQDGRLVDMFQSLPIKTGVNGCRSGNLAIVAVTNNPVSVGRATLVQLGISRFFLQVIGLDSHMRPKPSHAIVEAASTALSCGVEAICSVGDRYNVDIEPFVQRGGAGVLVESMEDVYNLPALLSDGSLTGLEVVG